MERIYAKLYQLAVKHTFYTTERSNDFTFAPIGNARKNLRSNGLLFKEDKNGFELLYRTINEEGDPTETIDPTQYITFGISVQNEKALYYTEFPSKTNTSDIYYCKGDYNQETLNLSTVAIRQPKFVEDYLYNFQKLTFRILDKDENIVHTETQTGLQDEETLTNYHFSFSVNFGNTLKIGVYKIQTLNNGILQDELEVYIFNRFEYPNLIGIFELELNKLINYEEVPYKSLLEFEPLSSKWVYQIELTRDFDDGDISITNSDVGSAISFAETSGLAGSYTKGETVIFEASDVMVKNEQPNTQFNLIVENTTNENDMTMNSLPNPPHHNSNSIIYLKI